MEYGKDLFEELRTLGRRLAGARNVPVFMVPLGWDRLS